MKQQFLVEKTGTFKTNVYKDNRKITPTSPLLTVYKPGGTEKLIDGVTMLVAPDGQLSYALTAVHNDDAAENYRAEVTYTYNSETDTKTIFYDVVHSILGIVITDDDLLAELPQLKDKNFRVFGTADSGSTTTIVDDELKRYADDYFTGGLAHSLTQDQIREITDFVSSTGTITTTAFSTAVATDKYVLLRSFGKEIRRAFEKIEEKLKQRGKRPQLVLDSYDIREPHLLMSVAEVCKGFITDGEGSFWWELWKDYEEKGNNAFASVNLKYDASADGYISGDEASRRVSSIKVRF